MKADWYERVKRMVIKEFIQVLRDKRMRGIMFLVPIMQLLAFGYAVTMDVSNIRTAVYDLDNTQESRELVQRLRSSGYFSIDQYPRSPRELAELLDRGKAVCAVQIDPGFSSDVRKGRPAHGPGAPRRDRFKQHDGGNELRYENSCNAMGSSLAEPGFLRYQCRSEWKRGPGITDLRSKNYNVPGVIAVMIMLICLTLTSMSVVREREMGTIGSSWYALLPIELILEDAPLRSHPILRYGLVTAVGVSRLTFRSRVLSPYWASQRPSISFLCCDSASFFHP